MRDPCEPVENVVHIGSAILEEYRFNGMFFKQIAGVRYLGILFESDRKFVMHINMIVRVEFAALFIICGNTHSNNPQTFIRLDKAM